MKNAVFDDKLKNVNEKITSKKKKHVLLQNEFKKLQIFKSSLFIGQSYFNNDWAQFYLILQPFCYTLKRLGYTEKAVTWKPKGLLT